MANQFFEIGGLRIDLSKVISTGESLAGLKVRVDQEDSIQTFLSGRVCGEFRKALEAYRESLKPKYQFKDGWYICGFEPRCNPNYHLRYFKEDKSYDERGRRLGNSADYVSTLYCDDCQPPPPESFRD